MLDEVSLSMVFCTDLGSVLYPCRGVGQVRDQASIMRASFIRVFDTSRPILVHVLRPGWCSLLWKKLPSFFIEKLKGLPIMLHIFAGGRLNRSDPLTYMLFS